MPFCHFSIIFVMSFAIGSLFAEAKKVVRVSAVITPLRLKQQCTAHGRRMFNIHQLHHGKF